MEIFVTVLACLFCTTSDFILGIIVTKHDKKYVASPPRCELENGHDGLHHATDGGRLSSQDLWW